MSYGSSSNLNPQARKLIHLNKQAGVVQGIMVD